ncbi:uncharacterized [Tachysurus ichikawai]
MLHLASVMQPVGLFRRRLASGESSCGHIKWLHAYTSTCLSAEMFSQEFLSNVFRHKPYVSSTRNPFCSYSSTSAPAYGVTTRLGEVLRFQQAEASLDVFLPQARGPWMYSCLKPEVPGCIPASSQRSLDVFLPQAGGPWMYSCLKTEVPGCIPASRRRSLVEFLPQAGGPCMYSCLKPEVPVCIPASSRRSLDVFLLHAEDPWMYSCIKPEVPGCIPASS